MNDDLKDYNDIINFVSSLPGSCPVGGIIKPEDHEEKIMDPRVERELYAQDAQYIFDKYFITPIDRRKLIAAILNVRITS